MFLVTVYRLPPAHKPWLEGREQAARFVVNADEGKANFHAGAEADALTDADGREYDWSVEPIEVRT